jgi:hypothetical protein
VFCPCSGAFVIALEAYHAPADILYDKQNWLVRMNRITVFIALVCSVAAAHAPAADATNPPPVTLQENSISPEQAFANLGELVGATFKPSQERLWSDSGRPSSIDVDIQNQPFWIAVNKLCELSRVEIQFGSEAAIRLSSGNEGGAWGNSPVAITGPLMIVGSELHRTHTADLREPVSIRKELYLAITIYIDPRVRLTQNVEPFKIREAVDEKGQHFTQFQTDSHGTFQSPYILMNSLHLELPESPGQKVAKLAGTASFLADVNTQNWEIQLPLTAPAVRKVGRFPVTVEKVERSNNQFRVNVRCKCAKGEEKEFARYHSAFQDFVRRIEMRDENDNVWRTSGSSGSLNSQEVSYTLDLSADEGTGEPSRLIWPLPDDVQEINLPFEFTNLPME